MTFLVLVFNQREKVGLQKSFPYCVYIGSGVIIENIKNNDQIGKKVSIGLLIKQITFLK